MKTNKEILDEFKKDFHRIDRFAREGVIYGKEGQMVFSNDGSQMQAIYNFIENALEQKDKEWREKMIKVLEGVPMLEDGEYHGASEELLDHIEGVEDWQQEQINKLK